MGKKLLSNAEKIRIIRIADITSDFKKVREDNPKALKSVIVKYLAERHRVSESTVRNILKEGKGGLK